MLSTIFSFAHKLRARLWPLLLAAALAACASLPTQEMSDARQAIAAAVDAGAETHAADALSQARAMLESAESALRDGEYDTSRNDAVQARDFALEAQATAIAKSADGE